MSTRVSRSYSSLGRQKTHSKPRKRTIQDTLLNEEERAALESIDASLTTGEEAGETFANCLGRRCRACCCNRAMLSMLAVLVILFTGIVLVVIAQLRHNGDTEKKKLRCAGSYLISAGLFGLLGGCANLTALLMLFYKFPLVYGTGVFQRQHKQIGNIICRIVVQMLFDSEHLKNYILERISKFSIDINIMESIDKGLKSDRASMIIGQHLDELYTQPESQYLISLGISRSMLTPMIRPAILSLCAEAAPYVLTHDTEERTVNIPKLRDAITGFLLHRVDTLSKSMVSSLMKRLLFHHLKGLIMYGCIVGCIMGLLAQIGRLTLNPKVFEYKH